MFIVLKKNTRIGQKHIFWNIFKVDHVGLVSKDILGLIKVLLFWFGMRMGGKKVGIDFEML